MATTNLLRQISKNENMSNVLYNNVCDSTCLIENPGRRFFGFINLVFKKLLLKIKNKNQKTNIVDLTFFLEKNIHIFCFEIIGISSVLAK